jgi:hypothetical protein
MYEKLQAENKHHTSNGTVKGKAPVALYKRSTFQLVEMFIRIT